MVNSAKVTKTTQIGKSLLAVFDRISKGCTEFYNIYNQLTSRNISQENIFSRGTHS